MGYWFEDENNDDLGCDLTVSGRSRLHKLVDAEKGRYPALEMLLEHGMTHLTSSLALECREIAQLKIDTEMTSMMKEIGKAAKKANGIIIMTAGVL